jgi:hypothetical protein
MLKNFIKTYPEPKDGVDYKYTTMVRHKGTVIAFAMDSEQRIWYSVLDLSNQEIESPIDVNYWLKEPKELLFSNEIVQVGYYVVGYQTIPEVKQGEERDNFMSTTARLTADAPFQVLSDGKYVYVFRQTTGAGHNRMIYITDASGNYITDQDGNKIPIVNNTLLLDRFSFVGTDLKPKSEVRFQRSRRKDKPQSRKDSLGYKDMEEKPFYEPTQELVLIGNLVDGRFSVLVIPTSIPEIQRWQIFTYNSKTQMIDSFNIERSEDGLFNTRGTQYYTSPDPQYQKDVFESKPGQCPFTGKDLIPIISRVGYAEWALVFDGQDDYIQLSEASSSGLADNDFTVGAWIKGGDFSSNNQAILGTDKTKGLCLGIRKGKPYIAFNESETEGKTKLSEDTWYHLTWSYTKSTGEQAILVNGVLDNVTEGNAAVQGTGTMQIGRAGFSNYFIGQIDEVRIWNRARSQDEIKTEMYHRLVGNEPGLVGYWRFDEGSGNTVYDLTDNAYEGTIKGDAKWVASDAPVGDHPGVRRTSFKFNGRTVESGIAALLYYQQEKAVGGYDSAEAKPLKKNGRVMLAVATKGAESEKKEITILDFGVSREGKLAQVPDNIVLPILHRTPWNEDLLNESLNKVFKLEREIGILKKEINSISNEMDQLEMGEIENKFYYGRFRQLVHQMHHKQQQLRNKQTELDSINLIAQGDIALPMSLVHLDPFGLTISGAVLSFAWTNDNPLLFDSANGKLGLYFRGVNDQFFSVYYDTLTDKALYYVPTDSIGNVVFIARSAGSDMDQASIKVSDGSDSKDCVVTIEHVKMGVKEIWKDVPRDPEKFVQILNGNANTDPKDPFFYDYNKASVENPPVSLAKGSLLFTLVNDNATGQVQNCELEGSGLETRTCQWIAYSQGNALFFDGQDDYVSLEDNSKLSRFAAEGDLTMETWIKPDSVKDISRVILHNSHTSKYTLGLKGKVYRYGLEFDGKSDWIEIPNVINGLGQLTIEAWFKYSDSETWRWIYGSGPGYVDVGAAITKGHNTIRYHYKPIKIGFPVGGLEHRGDGKIRLVPNRWYHLALIYDGSKVSGYINNELDFSRDFSGKVFSLQQQAIGAGYWHNGEFFKGGIAEVRIWNYARTLEEIKANMNHRLSGNETGLIGYWHFEDGTAKDYSGNEKHGVVKGNPQHVVPTYALFAGVGENFVTTKEAICCGSWTQLCAVFNQSYALRFDGKDDYLDCGNDTTLDISGDLTLEAFIQVDDDDLSQPRGILTKGKLDDGTDKDVSYSLYIDTDRTIVFAFEDKGHNKQTFKSNKNLETDQFYKIGVTRRKVINIEKEKVEEWEEIKLFINGSHVGGNDKYQGKGAGNNNQPLEIGKAYLEGAKETFFKGTMSEVRLWNTALDATNINSSITGREKGLISWWRFEEKQGTMAFDSKSQNHGTRTGAKWVKNPDPQGSSFRLYVNGVPKAWEKMDSPLSYGSEQFTLGGCKNTGIQETFHGLMDEVRIWKVPRTQEQIHDNLFRRLLSEKEDLIAYYQFDAAAENKLEDVSGRDNHLLLGGNKKVTPNRPTWVVSSAPVGYDTPQVRSALAGVKTGFHDLIHSRPAVQEYGDIQIDAEGNLTGILKRCYTLIKNGEWHLITGFKVGDLISEWIGQAQYDPQLIGYIEGAPPVPSENLTAKDPEREDYVGAASIELTDAQSVMYAYSASRQSAFEMSLDAKIGALLGSRASAGLGFQVEVAQATSKLQSHFTFELSLGWLDEARIGLGKTTTKISKMELTGSWEAENERRFIPANVGFALVQSETADVFALRLKHNNALVCYRMQANPDIPKDWNILTFPINPRYIKQGTLDGKVGFECDPDFPDAITYGEWSYFKAKEAYALKNKIQREEEKEKNIYDEYEAGAKGRGFDLRIWTSLSDVLPKLEKRNIVNTYVWTADGGFFAESSEIMDVRQETTGGTYSMKAMGGVYTDLNFKVGGVGMAIELDALFGGSLNLAVTKGVGSETSFGMNMEIDIDQNVQQPGKIDAYRFMTFYLQPKLEHFEEFINKVIDRDWLETSDHPNAIALRDAVKAQQRAKKDSEKSIPWRVLHRVTYVSRILPEVPTKITSVSSLEERLKAANINSNYQLIKKLEPFVKDKVDDYFEFTEAVCQAVENYLPELIPNKEDIVQYMCLYFQVFEA